MMIYELVNYGADSIRIIKNWDELSDEEKTLVESTFIFFSPNSRETIEGAKESKKPEFKLLLTDCYMTLTRVPNGQHIDEHTIALNIDDEDEKGYGAIFLKLVELHTDVEHRQKLATVQPEDCANTYARMAVTAKRRLTRQAADQIALKKKTGGAPDYRLVMRPDSCDCTAWLMGPSPTYGSSIRRRYRSVANCTRRLS